MPGSRRSRGSKRNTPLVLAGELENQGRVPSVAVVAGVVKSLGGFLVPVRFAEVAVVPVRIEFGGDAEAEGRPLGVVGLDVPVDVLGGGKQLQRGCEAFVKLVAVEPNVDVGDD